MATLPRYVRIFTAVSDQPLDNPLGYWSISTLPCMQLQFSRHMADAEFSASRFEENLRRFKRNINTDQ